MPNSKEKDVEIASFKFLEEVKHAQKMKIKHLKRVEIDMKYLRGN